MAAPSAERKAHGGGKAVIMAVTRVVDASVGIDLDTGIFLVENEVGDTGDSVRTIGRRGAAGDDLDSLDQRLREGVDVH